MGLGAEDITFNLKAANNASWTSNSLLTLQENSKKQCYYRVSMEGIIS